jgi:REP element-mobilizing transposase RayT
MPAFLTWRLAGCLPPERVFEREHLTTGEAFVAWDRLLDTAGTGPSYLGQAEIASLVMKQLHDSAAGGSCILHAFVIMPNHVHLMATPTGSLAELVRRIKGATACLSNRILGRTGEQFWQDEYFDRIVRKGDEFDRIQHYIEWNPVKAGLVTQPEQSRWFSASPG